MAAGSIVVDLLLRTGSFRTDADRAAKASKKLANEIDRQFTSIATTIGLAAGIASGVLVTLAKSTIDNADRLAKLAQSTGITTEALSEFEYAASLAGVSSDQFTTAINKLSRSATEAAEGTKEQAEAYAKLGVSVTDASGKIKDGETLFLDVADAFSKLRDGPAKAALAMEILGKAGAKLIPLLNGGRQGIKDAREEAAAFGVTVRGESAKAAEEFNDTLNRLKTVGMGVAKVFGESIAPALTAFGNQILDAKKAGMGFIEALIGLGTVDPSKTPGDNVKRLRSEIDELRKETSKPWGMPQEVFDAAMANRIEGLEKQLDYWQRQSARAALAASKGVYSNEGRGLTQSALSDVPIGTQTTKIKTQSAGAPKVSDLEKMSKAFADQAATVGKTSEEIELYRYKLAGASPAQLAFAASVQDSIRSFEAQAKAMSDGKSVTEAVRTPAEAYSAEVERLNALLNQAAISQETYNRAVFAAQDVLDGTNESLQSLNAMLDATPTAKLEKSRADMLLLRDAFVAGKISAEEFVEAAGTRLGTLPDTIDTATDSMSAFADQAARNMQGAFADFLFDPFADGVDGMLNSFGITLRRMAAEAAAAKIFNAVGDWGKSNSNSGGFLGAISSIIGVFGGARADGGSVMSGKTYLVGERGPEYFRPGTSGTIVPNEAIGRSSSDMTINQTIYAGQGTDHAQVRRSAAAGARSALGVMSGARRYG